MKHHREITLMSTNSRSPLLVVCRAQCTRKKKVENDSFQQRRCTLNRVEVRVSVCVTVCCAFQQRNDLIATCFRSETFISLHHFPVAIDQSSCFVRSLSVVVFVVGGGGRIGIASLMYSVFNACCTTFDVPICLTATEMKSTFS